MRSVFLTLALLACGTVANGQTTVTLTTAQADAELMARTGVMRHCGRAGGRREGIGFSTVSADHAVRSSCFYGRYRIVERAVVWSPIRRGWFAVIRYE